MLKVDDVLGKEEMAACSKLAYAMGLNRAKVDHLMSELEKAPKSLPEFEKMKARFEEI